MHTGNLCITFKIHLDRHLVYGGTAEGPGPWRGGGTAGGPGPWRVGRTAGVTVL